MTLIARVSRHLAAAALAGASVLAAPQAAAQALTPEILVERAEILDQITRYYYNIRSKDPQSFARFFTPDGELILGTRSLKGHEAIANAYVRSPDNFNANAFSFNILVGNPLITVNGNTATSKVTFTEVLLEKEGGLPRIVVSAREYATWKKGRRHVAVQEAQHFRRHRAPRLVAGIAPPRLAAIRRPCAASPACAGPSCA